MSFHKHVTHGLLQFIFVLLCIDLAKTICWLQYFPFLFYYDLFSLYLILGIENAEHFCVNKKRKWQGEQSTQNMERCESIMMIRTTVRVQIITDF